MLKKISILVSLILISLISYNFIMKKTDSQPTLTYLVKQPTIESENPPLIILLHGVGSNEKDLFSFADALPKQFKIVSVRGPITLNENQFAWFQVQFTENGSIINKDQAENSRKELLKFIEDLKQVEKFDSENVYLVGFSQGGIMSYSVALTEPKKIKGIGILSSRLLPEIKPIIASNEQLSKLKLFISHGTQDPVLKYNNATEAVDFLKSKGLTPEFHTYNAAHTVTQEMLKDLIIWLDK